MVDARPASTLDKWLDSGTHLNLLFQLPLEVLQLLGVGELASGQLGDHAPSHPAAGTAHLQRHRSTLNSRGSVTPSLPDPTPNPQVPFSLERCVHTQAWTGPGTQKTRVGLTVLGLQLGSLACEVATERLEPPQPCSGAHSSGPLVVLHIFQG